MVADVRHRPANARVSEGNLQSAKEGARGNRGSLGVLSWVTFFAQAKKVIKNLLTRPRCGRMGISKQKLLSSPTDSRAQRALVKDFYVHFFAPRKETNQRNEPETPAVSQALPLAAARGRRHWLKGKFAPHRVVRIRRASVRSSLARLFKILVSPVDIAMEFAEND